jgi:hypothetical protein
MQMTNRQKQAFMAHRQAMSAQQGQAPGMIGQQKQLMPMQQQIQQLIQPQQGLFQGPPNAPGQMSPFGQMLGGLGGMFGGQQRGSPYGPQNTSMIGNMPGVNPQNLFSALSFMRGLPGMGQGGQQPFGQMNLPQQFQGPQRYAF